MALFRGSRPFVALVVALLAVPTASSHVPSLRHALLVGDTGSWQGAVGHARRGVMHIWARCLKAQLPFSNSVDVQLRGFVFAEDIDFAAPEGGNLWSLVGPVPEHWVPRAFLETANGTRVQLNAVHTTRGAEHVERGRIPISLYAVARVENAFERGGLQVGIEGIPQVLQMSIWHCDEAPSTQVLSHNRSQQQQAPKDQAATKAVMAVLFTPFGQPLGFVASIIRAHIQYHLCVGVQKYEIYANADQEAQLGRSPHLGPYLASGQLSLVPTNNLPTYSKHPYAWQDVIYNHAVLRHWGGSSRLFLIDPDEYLALPSRVPAGLGGIFQLYTARVLFFHRHDVLSTALSTNPAQESLLWRSNATGALASYDLLDKQRNNRKGLVDPDFAFNAFTHTAQTLDPADAVEVSMQHAALLHLKNLWRGRTRLTAALLPKLLNRTELHVWFNQAPCGDHRTV